LKTSLSAGNAILSAFIQDNVYSVYLAARSSCLLVSCLRRFILSLFSHPGAII